jgi:uncharacterized protein (DUF58 family)
VAVDLKKATWFVLLFWIAAIASVISVYLLGAWFHVVAHLLLMLNHGLNSPGSFRAQEKVSAARE